MQNEIDWHYIFCSVLRCRFMFFSFSFCWTKERHKYLLFRLYLFVQREEPTNIADLFQSIFDSPLHFWVMKARKVKKTYTIKTRHILHWSSWKWSWRRPTVINNSNPFRLFLYSIRCYLHCITFHSRSRNYKELLEILKFYDN